MRRLAVAAVATAALAAAWSALGVEHASAHAAIERTDPANGAILDTAPSEIRLAFTEPPDLSLTVIGVVDATGANVPTGPVERVARANQEVRVALDETLSDGVYTVTWRTVSTTDGHVTSGAFSFGVGVAPGQVTPVAPGSRAESPTPSALAVAGRWALYVGLAVLFGAAIAGLLAFGPRRVARPWPLALAWILSAVGAVVMMLQERASIGVPLGTLLSSDTGGAFVRLLVAVGFLGLATLVVTLRPNRATLVALAATAGAAMLARAEGGHAGGSLTTTAVQWLHVAGGGAWLGGLGWLVLGLRRGLEPERVRRFSNLAAGGLAVVVLSGVLRASNELGFAWWLHPLANDYRTALLVKLAVVVPLVALGARNRLRNVPRFEDLGPRPLLRTVGGELALAGVVFAVTGVLTGLPPRGVEAAEAPLAPEPLVVTGSDFATTTKARLQISPGTVGPNAFVVQVTDYDTGEPVDARRVRLEFALPDRPEFGSTLELERGVDGSWQAGGTDLALDGTWTVTVLVELADGSVEVPLEVTPKPPEQRVEVSRQPGQPDLYTISLNGGMTIQAYVDPGEPGRTNQVHVTAFDPDGAELPLDSAVLTITSPGGEPLEPELLRFGAGHFVANVDIAPGTSSFAVSADTSDGRVLTASFEQTFEE